MSKLRRLCRLHRNRSKYEKWYCKAGKYVNVQRFTSQNLWCRLEGHQLSAAIFSSSALTLMKFRLSFSPVTAAGTTDPKYHLHSSLLLKPLSRTSCQHGGQLVGHHPLSPSPPLPLLHTCCKTWMMPSQDNLLFIRTNRILILSTENSAYRMQR